MRSRETAAAGGVFVLGTRRVHRPSDQRRKGAQDDTAGPRPEIGAVPRFRWHPRRDRGNPRTGRGPAGTARLAVAALPPTGWCAGNREWPAAGPDRPAASAVLGQRRRRARRLVTLR